MDLGEIRLGRCWLDASGSW